MMAKADKVPTASGGHGPLPRWGWAAVVAAGALVPVVAIGPLAGAAPAPLGSGHGLAGEPCQVTSRKVAAPGAVLLGETVAVSLAVDAPCQGEEGRLRLVLTLESR
ncbi:MAG: hypothetical protein ACE5EL_05935 [Anaerolineae bacterium]